jgi:hypothetical protein
MKGGIFWKNCPDRVGLVNCESLPDMADPSAVSGASCLQPHPTRANWGKEDPGPARVGVASKKAISRAGILEYSGPWTYEKRTTSALASQIVAHAEGCNAQQPE